MANYKYYQEELSKIHDDGFNAHAIKSFPFILSAIKKYHKQGLIVELGCGTGITAGKLIKNNYSVLGIDLSPSMIKLAKAKVPGGKFIVKSFYNFEFPKCISVLAVGEIFNYNFENKTNYRSLQKVFSKIYDALDKNGLFIFDILEENQNKNNKSVKSFTEGKDWFVLTEKIEHKRKHELERRIITFYKSGTLYRKQEEVHIVKLFNSEILKEILQGIGFTIYFSRSYGKYKLRDNQAVFVCKK